MTNLKVIVVTAIVVLVSTYSAAAQQAEKNPRIGYISNGNFGPRSDGF